MNNRWIGVAYLLFAVFVIANLYVPVVHAAGSGSFSITNITIPSYYSYITLGPSGATLYAASPANLTSVNAKQYNATIRVINVSTERLTAEVGIGAGVSGMAAAPSGSSVYALTTCTYGGYTEQIGCIDIINTSTYKVTGNIRTNGVSTLALSPNGKVIYGVNPYINQVEAINAQTDAAMGNITVGSGADDVAFEPSGAEAFVLNYGSKTISVINVSTSRVVDTIAVPGAPQSIAISSPGTFALVLYNATVGADGISEINLLNDSLVHLKPIDFANATAAAFFANRTEQYVPGLGTGAIALNPSGTVAYIVMSRCGKTSTGVTGLNNYNVNESFGCIDFVSTSAFPYYASVDDLSSSITSIASSINFTFMYANFSAGSGPDQIVLSPSGNTAFVAYSNQGYISALNVSGITVPSLNLNSTTTVVPAATTGSPPTQPSPPILLYIAVVIIILLIIAAALFMRRKKR